MKIFKNHIKGGNDKFEEFDCVKLDEMLGNFYMELHRSSLSVNKCLT